MMVGDYAKALTDFNDAIRIEPTESDHYFKRGMVYEKLGKNQEAADSFTSAIKFNDKNVEAYRHGATARSGAGPQRSGDRVPRQSGCDRAASATADEVAKLNCLTWASRTAGCLGWGAQRGTRVNCARSEPFADKLRVPRVYVELADLVG